MNNWAKDTERKQGGADGASKRAMESDVSDGDNALLMRQKENKFSTMYDPDPYSVEDIWRSLSEAKPYLRGV